MMNVIPSQPTFPDLYERWLVPPLFQPWVEDLFHRVGLASGDHVVDIACGTGIVARMAKQRAGGRVVGIDVNAHMLAAARRAAPDIEWREGTAVQLPVAGDETFDVAFCQQGLQFFPEQPAAVREMRRVLASRGRAAVAVWRPLEEMPFLVALHRVAERHLGAVIDRRHSLGDDRMVRHLLEGGGFGRVEVETVSRRLRFSDPAMFLRLNAMALVGMRHAPNTIPEDERSALVDTIARGCEPALAAFASADGGVEFEMRTNVAAAFV